MKFNSAKERRVDRSVSPLLLDSRPLVERVSWRETSTVDRRFANGQCPAEVTEAQIPCSAEESRETTGDSARFDGRYYLDDGMSTVFETHSKLRTKSP